jgi:hypothetical protein
MGLKKYNNQLNNIQGKKGSQFSSQLRGINLERVLEVRACHHPIFDERMFLTK